MLKEFKKFALKGNVLDLAIGVIIGGAFGKIVPSRVGDIIMPIFSLILGRINLKELKWVIPSNVEGLEDVVFSYGQFIQNVVDFLIISFSISCLQNYWHHSRKRKRKSRLNLQSHQRKKGC